MVLCFLSPFRDDGSHRSLGGGLRDSGRQTRPNLAGKFGGAGVREREQHGEEGIAMSSDNRVANVVGLWSFRDLLVPVS